MPDCRMALVGPPVSEAEDDGERPNRREKGQHFSSATDIAPKAEAIESLPKRCRIAEMSNAQHDGRCLERAEQACPREHDRAIERQHDVGLCRPVEVEADGR